MAALMAAGSSLLCTLAVLAERSMVADASGSAALIAFSTVLTQWPQVIFCVELVHGGLHDLRPFTCRASHHGKVKKSYAKKICRALPALDKALPPTLRSHRRAEVSRAAWENRRGRQFDSHQGGQITVRKSKLHRFLYVDFQEVFRTVPSEVLNLTSACVAVSRKRSFSVQKMLQTGSLQITSFSRGR